MTEDDKALAVSVLAAEIVRREPFMGQEAAIASLRTVIAELQHPAKVMEGRGKVASASGEIVRLRQTGVPVAEIARRIGVTPQAIWYNRRKLGI